MNKEFRIHKKIIVKMIIMKGQTTMKDKKSLNKKIARLKYSILNKSVFIIYRHRSHSARIVIDPALYKIFTEQHTGNQQFFGEQPAAGRPFLRYFMEYRLSEYDQGGQDKRDSDGGYGKH